MNAHVRADFGSVSVSIHRLDAATGLDLDLGTDALHLLVARGGDLRIVLRPHEGGTVSRSATGPQPAADEWPATAGRTASQVCDGEGARLHSLADCELFTAEGCESVVISVPLELAAELEGFSDVGTAPLLLAGTPMLLMPMAAFASQAARGDGAPASALSVYYVEKLIQEMMLGIVAHTARISRPHAPGRLQRRTRRDRRAVRGPHAQLRPHRRGGEHVQAAARTALRPARGQHPGHSPQRPRAAGRRAAAG